MKTCTIQTAIELIEHGTRCTQSLDLAGPMLVMSLFAAGVIGAAIIAAGFVRVLF